MLIITTARSVYLSKVIKDLPRSLLIFTQSVSMFVDITLPWQYKCGILLYDVFLSFLSVDMLGQQMYVIMFRIFMLSVLCICAHILPSVLLSVHNRIHTNTFVSELLCLLMLQGALFLPIYTQSVNCELVCYALQFSTCFTMYCLWVNASQSPKLLAGRSVVRVSSFLCMPLFPLIFSHALTKGMHLSPNILAITFAGEILGTCSALLTSALRGCTVGLSSFTHLHTS